MVRRFVVSEFQRIMLRVSDTFPKDVYITQLGLSESNQLLYCEFLEAGYIPRIKCDTDWDDYGLGIQFVLCQTDRVKDSLGHKLGVIQISLLYLDGQNIADYERVVPFENLQDLDYVDSIVKTEVIPFLKENENTFFKALEMFPAHLE
jgi:hypothetical protein